MLKIKKACGGSFLLAVVLLFASCVAASADTAERMQICKPPENIQDRWFYYVPVKYLHIDEFDIHIFATETVSDWMMQESYAVIRGMVGALKNKEDKEKFRGHQAYIITDADPSLNGKGHRNTGFAGYSLFNEALVCRTAVDTIRPKAKPEYRGWDTPVHEFGHAIEHTLKLERKSDEIYSRNIKNYNKGVRREYIAWATQKWFSCTPGKADRTSFKPWESEYLETIFDKDNKWLPDNSPRTVK